MPHMVWHHGECLKRNIRFHLNCFGLGRDAVLGLDGGVYLQSFRGCFEDIRVINIVPVTTVAGSDLTISLPFYA